MRIMCCEIWAIGIIYEKQICHFEENKGLLGNN